MNSNALYHNSYTPYSELPSAAVVKSSDGIYYGGSRIENIAFPLSISATQNALFCCLSEGKQPAELITTKPGGPLNNFWCEEYGLTIREVSSRGLADIEVSDVRMSSEIDITATLTNLLSRAQVKESNFPVSALVKTNIGYFSGVNIECSSWNLGLCAERVAIAKALAMGSKKLIELHIKTRDGEFTSPCGACRQVILEHMPRKHLYLYHKDNTKSVHFSGDLLPHSFQSSSLQKKKSST